MKKWEYKCEHLTVLLDIDSLIHRLNVEGQDGWEFCHQDHRFLVFKRPIKEISLEEIHEMLVDDKEDQAILEAVENYGESKFNTDYQKYLRKNIISLVAISNFFDSMNNKINKAKNNASS